MCFFPSSVGVVYYGVAYMLHLTFKKKWCNSSRISGELKIIPIIFFGFVVRFQVESDWGDFRFWYLQLLELLCPNC